MITTPLTINCEKIYLLAAPYQGSTTQYSPTYDDLMSDNTIYSVPFFDAKANYAKMATLTSITQEQPVEHQHQTQHSMNIEDVPILDSFFKKMTEQFDRKFEDSERNILAKIDNSIKNGFAKTAEAIKQIITMPKSSTSRMLINVASRSDYIRTDGDANFNNIRRAEDSEAPTTGNLVNINILNKQIQSVDELDALEEKLKDPTVVEQYIKYYTSIIQKVTHGTREMQLKTIIYQITNQLWAKSLLPGTFTWSGQSVKGERKALNAYVNIIRLIHAIMLCFENTAKLSEVEQLMKEKICKHAKSRAKNSGGSRVSVGRKPYKPRSKKNKPSATDYQENIKNEEQEASNLKVNASVNNGNKDDRENDANELIDTYYESSDGEVEEHTQFLCLPNQSLIKHQNSRPESSESSSNDMAFHDDENNLTQTHGCTQCGKLYRHRSNLSRHVRYECNKEGSFQCHFCLRTFKQKSHLKYHMAHKHQYL
ncbi:hypothetical protein RN001_009529 [Aquatica leii]|uniref:C2H2-type domain-containing protein n=1 Tax=Aquatica leii TaxID=1421715 RepID=A0AAN7QGF4_9COLE|nr:hypothetical protein RN001_009529 [Aquatica leii]